MQNAERWVPSKIVYDDSAGRYVPNPEYVALGSLPMVHALAEAYARVIADHARGKLLDCGCGDVPYYGIYQSRVQAVTCIDWRASVHGKTHIDQEVDLNGALPFAAGSFDTVLLADVLEHLAEPTRLLAELARVLAPGGKLLVMVPFLYNIHEQPHDYYRYTRFALERLLSGADLRQVELFAFGGYPDVLLDLLAKGLSPNRLLCRAFLFCVLWSMRTSPYQRWRAKTRERFPLGYCCVAQKS